MDNQQRELYPQELAKIAAEADKIAAEAEAIKSKSATDSLIQAANVRKAEAEADSMFAIARTNEEMARQSALSTLSAERMEVAVMSNDVHHRIYYFDDPVTQKTVGECMNRLSYWHRTQPGSDIEIVFTSPGGEMTPGFVLFDFIQQMKRDGHYITTSTLGMAASMASVLLQAGSKRVMSREAWLVIHEGGYGSQGTAGQNEDMANWFKRMQDRIVDIFVKASDKKLTAAKIRTNWKRRDWFINSEEALALGLVDEVR